MRGRVLAGAVAALTLGAALFVPGQRPAVAQQPPSVVSDQATNRFPQGLRFQVEAQGSDVTEVELRYAIGPDGVRTRVVARCSPERGPRVSCSAEITPPNPYLPPFTEVRYVWRVTDAAGATAESDERSIVYADTRFQWRESASGNLIVYTYNNADGRPLAAAGRASLDKTGALLRAPVTFPVRVVVYNSVPDMSVARQQRSQAFGEQVITMGERVSADTVLVLNDRGAVDTLQHELAHVVTKRAGEGGVGSLPAWLDEGTAVNAQDRVGSGYDGAFRAASSSDALLSLRSMTSATGRPEDINLFYGQAYAFVRYLIDTHGEAKFAQLFAVFKRGALADDASREVYGKDVLTLENEWRATLGLRPRTGGEARNEAPQATGTLTPFGVGGIATPTRGVGSRPKADDEGGGSSGMIIAIAVAAVAVVAAAGGGAFVLARRRR